MTARAKKQLHLLVEKLLRMIKINDDIRIMIKYYRNDGENSKKELECIIFLM